AGGGGRLPAWGVGAAPEGRGGLRQRPEVGKRAQQPRHELVRAVVVVAIAGAAVVTVLVAALESLPEVVVVLRLVDVHAAITVVRVTIGPRIAVVEPPAVLTICLAGHEAF